MPPMRPLMVQVPELLRAPLWVWDLQKQPAQSNYMLRSILRFAIKSFWNHLLFIWATISLPTSVVFAGLAYPRDTMCEVRHCLQTVAERESSHELGGALCDGRPERPDVSLALRAHLLQYIGGLLDAPYVKPVPVH